MKKVIEHNTLLNEIVAENFSPLFEFLIRPNYPTNRDDFNDFLEKIEEVESDFRIRCKRIYFGNQTWINKIVLEEVEKQLKSSLVFLEKNLSKTLEHNSENEISGKVLSKIKILEKKIEHTVNSIELCGDLLKDNHITPKPFSSKSVILYCLICVELKIFGLTPLHSKEEVLRICCDDFYMEYASGARGDFSYYSQIDELIHNKKLVVILTESILPKLGSIKERLDILDFINNYNYKKINKEQ